MERLLISGGTMPTKIVSFGFKYGLPAECSLFDKPDKMIQKTQNKGTLLDVRKILNRNPYHIKALRVLRGTDWEVQEEIQKTPGFWDSYKVIRHIGQETAGVFYIGCTGGHHRSVYIAELLAKEFNCPVEHRDIDKGRK